MKEQQAVIRTISNRSELETVFDMLGDIFPVGRDFFQKRLDHDSSYDLSTTWVASMGDTVASTVQLFPFQCRVEDAALKVGGIGSVATLPAYRGQGLSQQILKRQTEWMEEQEYDLSLLFAVITPFYEKLGWRVVPEPIYELTPAQAATEGPSAYEIEPFEASRLDELIHIYEQFNQTRTYTVIRTREYWQDQLRWPRWESAACLVAKLNGEVTAYGFISETKDGTAYLEELCYLKGHEEAAIPLFQALLKLRSNAARIMAKLPSDHKLLEAFTVWGAAKQTINFSMWKVIRFFPLLVKLTSVLQQRLLAQAELAGSRLSLHVECAGQHAYLHYVNAELSMEPSGRQGESYQDIVLTQEDFVALLLQGVTDDTREDLRTEVLSALFPQQPSIFYMTDKF